MKCRDCVSLGVAAGFFGAMAALAYVVLLWHANDGFSFKWLLLSFLGGGCVFGISAIYSGQLMRFFDDYFFEHAAKLALKECGERVKNDAVQ